VIIIIIKEIKESAEDPTRSAARASAGGHWNHRAASYAAILSNVLLSRTDNNIEFVATDIEIEITTSMSIEGAG